MRDTWEFRETYASWLMLQAYRLKEGNATLSYQDMKAALGEPVSSIPQERGASRLPEAGWWLRSVMGTGTVGVWRRWKQRFLRLRRGAWRLRRANRSGSPGTMAMSARPAPCSIREPSNAFSVTELESLATCPFRFFLKRGLGLRPVDGRERDRDVWLDPLTRGTELHDIYAALWRRCRDECRRPDRLKDGVWLTTLVEARLAALEQEMPSATAEIFARESRELLDDAELFLEAESEGPGYPDRLRSPLRAAAGPARGAVGSGGAGGDQPG